MGTNDCVMIGSEYFRGMDNDEFRSYDMNYFINLKNDYDNGKISKKELQDFYCRLLMNYIKSILKAKNITPNQDLYQDALQHGLMAISQYAPIYNPSIGTPPSEYFKFYIEQNIHTLLEKSKQKISTEYYQGLETLLNKAARELGYEGLHDPNLSKSRLKIKTKIEISTINEVIKQSSYVLESIDAVDTATKDSRMLTPEAQYIKNEEREYLRELSDRILTKLEKRLIEYLTNEELYNKKGKPRSDRDILKTLKSPRIQEMHRGEMPPTITQDYIKKVRHRALRKLYEEITKEYIKAKKNEYPERDTAIHEQASFDDLGNMNFEE